jgi:hypothetical protein
MGFETLKRSEGHTHGGHFFGFHPLQYHLTAYSRKIMEKMPVLFKNTPENIGHRKDSEV